MFRNRRDVRPSISSAAASLILSCGILFAPALVWAQAIQPPMDLNFKSSGFDSAWSQQTSAGGKIEVTNGMVRFEAPAHAKAHIQRSAGVNEAIFSGRIGQWASLYLVWDDNDWCGVGQLSPTPFGRLYSTTMANGNATEVGHRGIDFGLARWVRIILGGNYIRFDYSTDGKEWTEMRSVPRGKPYAGAPKLFAVGKYYEAADKPFGSGTDNKEGGNIAGAVTELHVTGISPERENLNDEELAELLKPKVDPVTKTLIGNDEDPTFEKIVGYYPPMKSPREVVGVAEHPLDIGVDRLGRLDVSPWTAPVAWFEIGDPPVPLGKEGVPFTRRLLHGYLPVDTLSITKDGIHYDLTIYGWSDQFNVDRQLFAYARLTARSVDGAKLPEKVALVSPKGKKHEWQLKSLLEKQVGVCIQIKYPDPESATEIAGSEFEEKLNQVANVWEKRLAPAERFDVPDARVSEAYRAWLVYSLLNADTINGYVEPHDGAGFYEEMFGCSVSLHSRALDYFGMHHYAERVLDTQLHFQQPDGLYTQACGLTDPGSLLIALGKHYEMTGDAQWLKRVTPNIIKLCDWLIREREKAPKDGTVRGLIKFRPYNDYPDPVYNFLGNAWCAEGMEVVAADLIKIGIPEGNKYAAEAKNYRKDILDSIEASAFVHDGQTMFDMEPLTQRLLKLGQYRGGDYYGLTASSLLETEFLPVNDKRTSWVVDMLEKRGGLIGGICEFEGGVDHAYTYGYLMTELGRDDVRKTLLGFWSMLAFGMTRDTYSPVEVTMIETGENHFTLPHLYSCTDQLRLLRNLLLREDGDNLWIGQAIPRDWLAAGKHIAVNSAPTEFGDVSYRIDALPDGNARIALTPPTRRAPSEIHLRLRMPGTKAIKSVKASPDADINFSGDTMILRHLKAPVDLEVTF